MSSCARRAVYIAGSRRCSSSRANPRCELDFIAAGKFACGEGGTSAEARPFRSKTLRPSFMKIRSQIFGILVALLVTASSVNALEVKLGLAEYLRMVIERNETIQAQLLATEASRRRALAERGTFEPELV